MSRNPSSLIPADYSPVPSESTSVEVSAVAALETSGLDAVAVLVHADGDLPADLGTDLDRAALAAAGFDGSPGSSLVVPRSGAPLLVLVGAGPAGGLDASALRDAAAAAARATARAGGRLGIRAATDLPAAAAGQARHRGGAPRALPLHRAARGSPGEAADPPRAGPRRRRPRRGRSRDRHRGRDQPRGRRRARPGQRPTGHLTASAMADVAAELGARYGFEVESFDKAQLIELGCGGILGVNAGSTEEPRMVKLRYVPDGEPTGHLGLVGKGIMYDSGGHQHQALRPHAPAHEDGHGRRGGRARCVHRAARPRHDERGHRLADVHRQHAVGLGLQARATCSPRGAAARSRSRTPTPRGAW